MVRKMILCALASAAMIPAAAPAQHAGGGGGGGGHGGGMGNAGIGGGVAGNAGGHGGDIGGMGNAAGNNGFGVTTRDASRLNSQGPANASATGIAHANQNSVLAGTSTTKTVSTGTLSGLSTGMTLYSNGTAIGTVQQIRTTGNGSVALVVVKGTNGSLYPVPANKLALSGGTLSTTARFNGINGLSGSQARVNSQGPAHASATGIAHANSHSVLAGGAVASASLPGLTTGLTVNTTGGTTLGTVTRVITGMDGTIRQVIVTSPTGQTYRLSPSTLTISGGVVTTSSGG